MVLCLKENAWLTVGGKKNPFQALKIYNCCMVLNSIRWEDLIDTCNFNDVRCPNILSTCVEKNIAVFY